MLGVTLPWNNIPSRGKVERFLVTSTMETKIIFILKGYQARIFFIDTGGSGYLSPPLASFLWCYIFVAKFAVYLKGNCVSR